MFILILLRSVFLGTMREIDWAFVDGPRIFAPELLKVLKITLKNIIILSISTITKFLKKFKNSFLGLA